MPIALAAADAAPSFLVQIVAVLVAASVIAYLASRLGAVPIVGFLITGVVIGPHALALVRDPELVEAAAEVGVILLLFTIGLEFSLERLNRIRTLIFGGGGLQVALSTAAVVLVLLLFGIDWRSGLFTGFLVSLSSTAIVLKLLASRGEVGTRYGQVCLGLLIFQDLAIIVMVLVVPMLGGAGGSPAAIARALGVAGAIIVAVLVVARRLMPPLLERVARTCSPELFLLSVIAICFGTAWLTSVAGVSVSLGAFLAGLVVSESRFSHHAFGEIMPLQILFSATFFVSVGMLLDLRFVAAQLPLVAAGLALVLIVKVATTAAAVAVLGSPREVAAAAALALAQVGEFSFVLNRTGRDVGLSPMGLGESGSQTFIAVTVLLMVATPQLAGLGAGLASRLELRRRRTRADALEAAPAAPDFGHLSQHVVVAGYGEAARRLVRVLRGSGVPFVITTLSPGGAAEAEADHLPVLRGDATRRRTLELAGAERAKMIVIADDDPATALRVVAVARSVAPTARIVVRARDESDAAAFAGEGADRLIADELESVVQLFADVLRTYQIPPDQIEAHEEAIRRGDYSALRESAAQPVVVCDLDQRCFETRQVTVRPGAAAAGRSPSALRDVLPPGLGLSQVTRNGEPVGPEDVLAPGDVMALAGDAAAFAAAGSLFRTGVPRVPPLPGLPPPAASPGSAPPPVAFDRETTITFTPAPGTTCAHLDRVRPVRPSASGCEECLRTGDTWVHLRICLSCGHVGCCDSSKNRHATAHHHATGHPIIRSLEPGETWGWCYVDEREI